MRTSKTPVSNKVLEFYSKLGRPLAAIEITRLESRCRQTSEILEELDELKKENKAVEKNGFWALKGTELDNRQGQDFVLDLKWRKLNKLTKWFRFVPFLKFVMANGSMVMGIADKNSDFDVLVAVENKRIFTTRYILNFIFSMLRARRMDDVKGSSPDMLCFNHFITAPTYKRGGLNEYGAELYRNLIPLYGNEKDVREFFEANWEYGINPKMNPLDLRFNKSKPNIFALILGWLLNGWFGDLMEKGIIEPIARRRLDKYLSKKPIKDRVIVSEEELEFHFQLQ